VSGFPREPQALRDPPAMSCDPTSQLSETSTTTGSTPHAHSSQPRHPLSFHPGLLCLCTSLPELVLLPFHHSNICVPVCGHRPGGAWTLPLTSRSKGKA
jgi:hypothetical protein